MSKAARGVNNETNLINNSLLYLVSLNPTSNAWEKSSAENGQNGTAGNAGINSGNLPGSEFSGSFASFVAAHNAIFGQGTVAGSVVLANITSTQLNSVMGAFGADPTTHVAWMVVDHNSQFAVVPEPATLLLAGLGVLGLVAMRRKRTA